jgi:hypothetical protein
MASNVKENVDYRLLNNLSKLVICSHCLQRGVVTPVPQFISAARRVINLCARCRAVHLPDTSRIPANLIPFRRKRPE